MSLGNEMDKILRLPAGTLGSDAKIELIGNREAIIDGCRGVADYDEDRIVFNLGKRQIKFIGRKLTIRAMERAHAEIEGYIISIEFE